MACHDRQGGHCLRDCRERCRLSRRGDHGASRRRLLVVALSHQYLVTEAIPALAARGERLPLLRDPDASYYLRQERDGLLLGPYEADARVHWLDGIPDDFANQLWPDDLDRLETYIADAVARVPLLGTVGVRRVINGPIPYTPDGNPLIGPVRGLPGFFQCCAFTFGIAQSGGAGLRRGRVDRRGRAAVGHLALRRAALRRLRDDGLHGRTRDGALPPRVCDRVSCRRMAGRAAGDADAALSGAEGEGSALLRSRRVGAGRPVRAS